MSVEGGLMHVVDRGGARVATLAWIGTAMKGSPKWIDVKDRTTSDAIADAMSDGWDLGELDFYDFENLDSETVRGWEGFMGYFAALRLCLGPRGFAIDEDAIVWPPR